MSAGRLCAKPIVPIGAGNDPLELQLLLSFGPGQIIMPSSGARRVNFELLDACLYMRWTMLRFPILFICMEISYHARKLE